MLTKFGQKLLLTALRLIAIRRKVFKRGTPNIIMAFDLILFQNFLSLKGLSPTYKKDLMYYALRLNVYGKFNQEVINRFLMDKSNQNNSARAFINLFKEFIIQYKEELIEKGELNEEEFIKALQIKIPQVTGRKKDKITISLTKEEMKRIFDALETSQLKLMFLVCYNGGLRLQELIRIRVNSFNWNDFKENKEGMGEVKVLGKGNKERISIIPNWLMKLIAEYIKEDSSIFTADSLLFPVSPRFFQIHIKRAGMVSRITQKGENGEYIKETIVTPHRLRHQLGHDLMKDGKHMRVIQEALGHSSISSTQRYTHLSKQELKEEMEYRN